MTKTKNATRQQILDVAADLFFREGFRAVGIDTIVEKSGVAKMTLYHYFPSKDALIVAYLEQSNQFFLEWIDTIVAEYQDDPKRQIVVLFEALQKLATNPACYGCSFQHAANEFPGFDQAAHQVAMTNKQGVRDRLYKMAQAASSSSPDTLADALLLLMDGMFVSTRMFGPVSPARSVAEAAATLVKAYCPA